MNSIPRLPLSVLVVSVAVITTGLACDPLCEPTTSKVSVSCYAPDAGPVAPDASFVLVGWSDTEGSCHVGVDGGAITLQVTGSRECGLAPANGVRAPGALVQCTVPPLEPGVYTVNSNPELTLVLPGDAGVTSCP